MEGARRRRDWLSAARSGGAMTVARRAAPPSGTTNTFRLQRDELDGAPVPRAQRGVAVACRSSDRGVAGLDGLCAQVMSIDLRGRASMRLEKNSRERLECPEIN
ncbi:unnamed protein product [Urochloa humidicola]